MSHDFTIRVKNGMWKDWYNWTTEKRSGGDLVDVATVKEKYVGLEQDQQYFFGLAGGIFYKAFNHEECMDFWSGDNSRFTISYQEALQGLEKVISLFGEIDYPDKSRIDYIRGFYERMKTDYINIKKFEICFD